jgi:hypothetical protein
MPVDPATFSAIIGAVAAAGTSAAQTAASEASKEGSGVAATIINQSTHSFRTASYNPNHGHWMHHPKPVSSVKDILTILRQEAEAALKKKSVTDQEMSEYFKHKYQLPGLAGAFVETTHTKFEMKGAGIGSEGLVLLYPGDLPDCLIGLLIRKIPGGDFGAGVIITSKMGWRGVGLDPEVDDDGSKGIDYIKERGEEGTDPACKFSEGRTMIAVGYGFEVEFAAGESAEFFIRDAGS